MLCGYFFRRGKVVSDDKKRMQSKIDSIFKPYFSCIADTTFSGVRNKNKLLGVFPFKKSKEEFMQYNDPSSLLREILGRVYEAQQSFENVSDLMFVYQMMYNGNSCNIRNECVHGRNYLAGGSLRFAFRVTLFAIYMIDFRIKTIKQNVSDIQDI